MLTVGTRRLVRRFLTLCLLLGCLAFVSSDLNGGKTGAAICCDQCFNNYDNCYDACNGNTACENACYNTLVNCHRYCNPDC